MLFLVVAMLQLTSMLMSAEENNFQSEGDERGTGTDLRGEGFEDEDDYRNNRIGRICSSKYRLGRCK